jgi:hypothetical protein
MASEYATKIQILNESMEDLEAIIKHADEMVLTICDGFVFSTA